MEKSPKAKEVTQDLLDFLEGSPTSEWAAKNLSERLEEEGFHRVEISKNFELQPGQKFYLLKEDSSLLAGIVGEGDLSRNGFKIVGAHTDSPGFRVKHDGMYEEEGYKQLGVEIYGGPLIASWTDRDLSLAGKVALGRDDDIVTRLWKSDRNLLRISQLPIHLNREVNDEGLKLDKEKHLPPITGQAEGEGFSREDIKELIAEDLAVETSEVKDFELKLYDTQPASVLGLDGEFFASGRIDNLMACFSAVESLLEADEVPESTEVVTLFDNEEVGSNTAK